MNERINYYVSLFEEIQQKISDPQVAVAILQQIGKDNRMQAIQSEMANENSKSQPATAKQLGFLKDLGVEVKPGLSSKEASALIKEAQESRRQ